MSANPIERVALDAIEFIEDLTADPLLDSEDVEMILGDVQAHAGIEAVSLRKRLRAALKAEASEGERVLSLCRVAFEKVVEHRSVMARLEKDAHDAIRDAAQACALIPEAPARESWRPISSAPRDGTVIWLYQPHDMGGFMFAGMVNADGVWINNLDLKVQNPTHWMPLPAPPQDQREG